MAMVWTVFLGWSLTKGVIVVAFAFFLFGVPLMAALTVLMERCRRESDDE
jgi:hypothetical protein